MRKIIILGIILFNIMGFASFSVEGGSFYCLKIKDVEENEKMNIYPISLRLDYVVYL